MGDTYPNPTADLNADITGASCEFRMMKLNGEFVLTDSAVIDTASTGNVHYTWVDGDTDVPGAYRCEFVVTYSNGTVQRFPQGSYLEIIMEPAVPAA